MRYLLLDRILHVKKDSSITALKNVALAEDVFGDHFFGYPVMPGAMLIDAFAQAGTALVEISSGHRSKALLLMVEQAKFRGLVRPGDQLRIQMDMLSSDSASARLDGSIHAGEKLVASARIVLGIGDPETFYPRLTRHLIESIYEVWLQDATLEGFDAVEESPDE